MTTDLEVARQGVMVAIADLDAAADALGLADSFVATYFTVEPGGRFLAQSSSLLVRIHESLGHQYRAVGLSVDHASGAVQGIWNTFERTDAQARIEFEKAQERYRTGTGLPPLTTPPPPISPHPQPKPATRSVDATTVAAPLRNPQTDTRVLDALNTWRDLKDGVDAVLSFEWLMGPFEIVGLHVPIDQFKRYMEGNYNDMADAAAGFFALSGFFHGLDEGVAGTTGQVHSHWQGRSSEAVQAWLSTFRGAAWSHSRALNTYGGALQMQAQTAKLVVDQIIDLLDDLADCVPAISLHGESLLEKTVSLTVGQLRHVLQVISVAARLLVKVVTRLELLYDALMIFLTLLTAGPARLDFPVVTTPQAPR